MSWDEPSNIIAGVAVGKVPYIFLSLREQSQATRAIRTCTKYTRVSLQIPQYLIDNLGWEHVLRDRPELVVTAACSYFGNDGNSFVSLGAQALK